MRTTPARGFCWRRRAALGVLGLWALLGLARLTRLAEPAEVPVGQAVQPFVAFARRSIPPGAGYLYVQPADPGADPGAAPRLRYELYPRQYANARASTSEREARELLAREQRRYVVVPEAHLYPPDHWLRQERDWFHRLTLDDDRYVLVVDRPR